MTSYSGLVAPRLASATSAGAHDVVVSAGGGAVGRRLMDAAIGAKSLSIRAASLRWLLVTGLNAGVADFGALKHDGAAAGITVERFVPDLPSILAGAKLSISQSGYNTVSDILVAGCQAVFIPFAAGGETEQSRRAMLLQERGLGVSVPEQDLTASRLALAIDQAMALPQPVARLHLDGAQTTAAILKDLLYRPRPSARH
jgi:predicted glycosyltransferase